MLTLVFYREEFLTHRERKQAVPALPRKQPCSACILGVSGMRVSKRALRPERQDWNVTGHRRSELLKFPD